MKKILGLDLGTNSIGWAVTENDFNNKTGNIIDLGSRIIPMSQDILGKFDAGQSISQTAERTGYRGTRRLYQRDTLRRERLHRVLNILGFLPRHYKNAIIFEDGERKQGQFKKLNEREKEVKLNYRKNDKDKYEFIFMKSFLEMAEEFEKIEGNSKIPYDWTLYYLRKKALIKKISKDELAWIILNFNQKRGYYQLRGDEEEKDVNKNEEYYALEVKEVEVTEDKNNKGTWYKIILENDWIYRRQSKESLFNWKGKVKEFIITTTFDKNGELQKDKEGNVKRSFRAVDSEKDWIAIKKKTEEDINKSGKFICEYVYDTLIQNPRQKIRGKLIKTIERKYYRQELEKILDTQIKLQPELFTNELYESCIEELYHRNKAHKNNIKSRGFKYLFIDDIIFYQRPLKTKKYTISGCQYEMRPMKNKYGNMLKDDDGKQIMKPINTISKSHPLFQEFRLWQFLKNLKIYKKEDNSSGKLKLNVDFSHQFLKSEEDWTDLFDFLNERKEIEQKNILDFFIKKKTITKKEAEEYRWNYVDNKKYPGNETRAQFISRLKKNESFIQSKSLNRDLNPANFLNEVTKIGKSEKSPELSRETQLWHIIYSVKDKNEYESALGKFAIKHKIDEKSFVENFKKFQPFKNDYGAYSEKALKKILPLMRRGKYWKESEIHKNIKDRIAQYMERVSNITVDINHKDFNEQLFRVSDDDIPKQLIRSFLSFQGGNSLTGLNTYQACYAVCERHSEVSEIQRWKTPDDIDQYLQKFKQHSLRNPIVEQVVTETLRTVRDIWKEYGDFTEIHVELGREMKNPADKRKQMTQQITENENTNYRIKQLLTELMNDGIKHIKPYSPSQQEILKIFEEGVFINPDTNYKELTEEDIEKIRKNSSPNLNDIKRYKLWLEQGYISPYTGEIIPLNELFTEKYQIEHIIPQSRYFDDSLSNKVICESEINPNPWKDNQTGYEFIKNMGGNEVPELSRRKGRKVKLFSLEQYEIHCNGYFAKNRVKLKKLLSEDIPEGFIERQMNDSRYISKLIKGLLSNIVRKEGEQEATSKYLVPVTGAITSKLKQDWGLNDKWNEIIAPRFKRLNKLDNKNDNEEGKFGYWYEDVINGKKTGKRFFRVQVPDEISKGFNKKRIDHRHHALDALVIACTTKDHINYITSLNTERKNHSLVSKIRKVEERQKTDKETGLIKTFKIATKYKIPWATFTVDAKEVLA